MQLSAAVFPTIWFKGVFWILGRDLLIVAYFLHLSILEMRMFIFVHGFVTRSREMFVTRF